MDDFLKKTTDIPNEFITDFFKISNNNRIECNQKIDFKLAVEWLNVTKSNLKRLLVSNFEINFDYTIEKINTVNKNGKGNHYELIMLTPDTFKELCQMSDTERGRQVRKYYLKLEKLLFSHYEDINKNINAELNLVKNNQKSVHYGKGGYIYGVRAQNTIGKPLIKFGGTENLDDRLNTYNTGNANNINAVFAIKVNDVFKVESCVKNLIKNTQYRKNKEIYEIPGKINHINFFFIYNIYEESKFI